MKSATPPTPPDPAVTAAAQTASNKETAGYQASMNMIDQNTPLGSLKYSNIGTDPITGAPKYQLDQTLSDSGQRSFDLQQSVGEALNNLALKGTGQVSSAFDSSQTYGNLPQLQGLDLSNLPGLKSFDSSKLGAAPTASEADYKQAQDALYNTFTSRLDPQYEQSQKALETQLINKGITQGSEAWKNEIANFQRGKTDAYQTAQNNAVTGATGIEQAQFGMANTAYQNLVANMLNDVQGSYNARNQGLSEQQASNSNDLSRRQQGITESNYLRELPINEISALLNGGQVQQPSFSSTPQTQVQGTDVSGIIQNNFNNQMGIYKQQQASNDALTGAVFSLAGSAVGGWATGGFA